MPFRVTQISDNHLSARHGFARTNWEATCRHLSGNGTDLIISTGDIVVDDPDEADTRAFARSCFDQLPAPWLVVPGNHDIGDGPPDPWQDQPVTADRVAAFVSTWGADRFVSDVEGWRLIGYNSIVMGSGLAAIEAEHDAWLVEQLVGADGRRIAMFGHKPVFISGLDDPPTSMAMPARGRDRMLELIAAHDVALVSTGHLHDFRARIEGATTYLWCPTTAFIAPGGPIDPYGGVRQIGLVELDFDDRAVTWRLVRPEGATDTSVREISAAHGSIRYSPPAPWDAA